MAAAAVRRIRGAGLSLCLLAGLAIPGKAAVWAQQVPGDWAAFTRLFQAYADSDRVVGASALVMRAGRSQQRFDYGMADRELGQKVDERTIFHWGSITKTLTAIGIMQLRDRQRLSLDDPIVRYLPELRRVHDPYNALDSITIRMLLAHTGGFMNPTWPYDDAGPAWQPFEPTTWDQLVALMPYQQLLFKPGSRFGYSNPAFIYLARVIEQLTGDPWDAYVQKNIFLPLRLEHSYFRGTPYHLARERSNNYTIVRDSSAQSRVVANGRDFDPGITTPNGGWNAPLSDLAEYVAFLTAAPRADAKASRDLSEAVLARASLQEMWRPVVRMGTAPTEPNAIQQWMGLSFFVLKRGERTLFGHTGSQAGFRSFLFFNPVTGAAVIAAFNTTNTVQPASTAYRRMYEAALDLIW